MEEKAIEIIKKSVELFMRNGVRSVTMDDIANELRISKKTLYKYFSNKNAMVKRAVELHCQKEECELHDVMDSTGNAIDQIIEIAKLVSTRLKNLHPSIIYDMEKYYPEAWELLDKNNKVNIFAKILANLNRGVEEGLYRDTINCEIVARLFVGKIGTIIDNEVFPADKYSFADVYLEMIRYHIRGIASEKGIAYLKKRIENESIKF